MPKGSTSGASRHSRESGNPANGGAPPTLRNALGSRNDAGNGPVDVTGFRPSRLVGVAHRARPAFGMILLVSSQCALPELLRDVVCGASCQRHDGKGRILL